jgi:CBS domain-containing protein
MVLQDILHAKGTEMQTIEPHATLDDVIQRLVLQNIGSLLVIQSDGCPGPPRLLGIITERDVLRTVAEHSARSLEISVSHVMSLEVITAAPSERMEDGMRKMTNHRVRHLPIVDQGRLQGIVSIGDIVKAHHDELATENHCMKSYIRGEGADVGVTAGEI